MVRAQARDFGRARCHGTAHAVFRRKAPHFEAGEEHPMDRKNARPSQPKERAPSRAYVPRPLPRPAAVPRPSSRLPLPPSYAPLRTKPTPRVAPPPLPQPIEAPAVAEPVVAAPAVVEPAVEPLRVAEPVVVEAVAVEPVEVAVKPVVVERPAPIVAPPPVVAHACSLAPSYQSLEPPPPSAPRRRWRYALAVAAAVFGAPALLALLGAALEHGADTGAVARAIADAERASERAAADDTHGARDLGTAELPVGEPAPARAIDRPERGPVAAVDPPPGRVLRPFDRAAAARLVANEARAAASRCPETGRVRVGVVFAPSGTPADVWLEGTPAYTCLARVLEGLRVEPFDGEPALVEVTVWLR
jgi:hypothetical protein